MTAWWRDPSSAGFSSNLSLRCYTSSSLFFYPLFIVLSVKRTEGRPNRDPIQVEYSCTLCSFNVNPQLRKPTGRKKTRRGVFSYLVPLELQFHHNMTTLQSMWLSHTHTHTHTHAHTHHTNKPQYIHYTAHACIPYVSAALSVNLFRQQVH